MKREQLVKHILKSRMFAEGFWHWYAWNFQFLAEPEHLQPPFLSPMVEALLSCDAVIPGFATRFFDEIATIGGREKDEGQYEQLLQRLAELFVIRRAVTFEWPGGATFAWEPTPSGSRKNPELTVTTAGRIVGIEVKAPALFKHRKLRQSQPVQLPARGQLLGSRVVPTAEHVTMPRDNVLKDFLLSAESKFAPFRTADPAFIGILVVVWDEHAYEAVSPLMNGQSGLFTPNSFARDANGHVLRFESVNSVVITRRLHEFMNAAAGQRRPLTGGVNYLDFEGAAPNAFLANPHGGQVSPIVYDCLLALPFGHPMLGSEFVASDIVWWSGGGQS